MRTLGGCFGLRFPVNSTELSPNLSPLQWITNGARKIVTAGLSTVINIIPTFIIKVERDQSCVMLQHTVQRLPSTLLFSPHYLSLFLGFHCFYLFSLAQLVLVLLHVTAILNSYELQFFLFVVSFCLVSCCSYFPVGCD